MITAPTSAIVTERVDDIPLLLTHMIQMGIPDILDTRCEPGRADRRWRVVSGSQPGRSG
jgi:hypothetical protein